MTRTWRPSPHRTRRAFTLVETVLSLGVMSFILIGLASAMAMAARTAPARDDPALQTIRLTRAMQALGDDVATAVAIASYDKQGVALTVLDRNGDGIDESIRYAVDEVAGTFTLTRQINANVAETLATDLSLITFDVDSTGGNTALLKLEAVPQDARVAPVTLSVRMVNNPS